MQAIEKLNILSKLREDIGEPAFRTSITNILVKEQVNEAKEQGKQIQKKTICEYVNGVLEKYGVKQFSYSHFKQIVK